MGLDHLCESVNLLREDLGGITLLGSGGNHVPDALPAELFFPPLLPREVVQQGLRELDYRPNVRGVLLAFGFFGLSVGEEVAGVVLFFALGPLPAMRV